MTSGARGIAVGAGTLPAPDRPAVLVVDCQRAFTVEVTGRGRTREALAGVAALAGQARELDLPLVWLQTTFDSPAELGPVWSAKVPDLTSLLPGSAAAEIHPHSGFRPDDTVISKRRASGFFATGLAQTLRAAGCDGVVVAGFTTGGCVRATAVDAASHDFLVYVASDAVADREPAVHASALADLASRYADVGTVAELGAWLRR